MSGKAIEFTSVCDVKIPPGGMQIVRVTPRPITADGTLAQANAPVSCTLAPEVPPGAPEGKPATVTVNTWHVDFGFRNVGLYRLICSAPEGQLNIPIQVS
jgi:hypothetical protein